MTNACRKLSYSASIASSPVSWSVQRSPGRRVRRRPGSRDDASCRSSPAHHTNQLLDREVPGHLRQPERCRRRRPRPRPATCPPTRRQPDDVEPLHTVPGAVLGNRLDDEAPGEDRSRRAMISRGRTAGSGSTRSAPSGSAADSPGRPWRGSEAGPRGSPRSAPGTARQPGPPRLDPEWDPVDARADQAHQLQGLVVERQVGILHQGAVDEQSHGFRLTCRSGFMRRSRDPSGPSFSTASPRRRKASRLVTRTRIRGQRANMVRSARAGVDHLLAVVDHHERLLVLEVVGDAVDRPTGPGRRWAPPPSRTLLPHPQRCGYRVSDQARLGDAREFRHPDTVRDPRHSRPPACSVNRSCRRRPGR